MNEYVNRKDLRDELYDADAITIDVAPVHRGRWIYHRGDYKQECSRCHKELRLRGVGIIEYFGPCNENYCPTCGAKMEGWVIE